MYSQPNIPYVIIQRLRLDETGETTFVCTRDGLPFNISGKFFVIVFCKKDTSEVVIIVTNEQLTRPANTTDRFVLDLTPQQRSQLPAEEYTGFIYELIGGATGKRDTRGWFSYIWLNEPLEYVEGEPIEPAFVQLDFGSLNATYVLMAVRELGDPREFSDETTATAAPLKKPGKPELVVIDELPYWKTAVGLSVIPTSPL